MNKPVKSNRKRRHMTLDMLQKESSKYQFDDKLVQNSMQKAIDDLPIESVERVKFPGGGFSSAAGIVDENGKPCGYGKWDFIVGEAANKP